MGLRVRARVRVRVRVKGRVRASRPSLNTTRRRVSPPSPPASGV